MSKNNKSLFDDYKKFERILKINPDNNVLDTSTEDFLAPTTLIPLLIHAIKKGYSRISYS